MSKSAITLSRITKSFGSTQVLKEISLDVSPGEVLVLIGASGSGKSTVLRIMSGLETADGGEIWVNEVPLHDRKRSSEICGHVGMVFQQFNLFPHKTALGNVTLALIKAQKLSEAEANKRGMAALSRVGLAERAHHYPAQLSGGQQQRVAVARALVLEPQVLLLDEPLSNLDARLRRKVRTDIRELQQRLGFTAVYVTHDQDEALAVSDRIIVMKEGVIAQAGAPRELYEAPASSFIADFMGEANVVACEVLGVENGKARVRIAGVEHSVPAGNREKLGAASLAVRPGAVTLSEGRGEGLSGRVLHSAYLGDHVEYEVETDVGTLFIVDHAVDRILPAASDATLGFKTRGIAIIDS